MTDTIAKLNTESREMEGLALRVINELSKNSSIDARKKIEETSAWLAEITATSTTFSHEKALEALTKKGISRDVLVDHCIPEAARMLGKAWTDNLRDFGTVTLGAARLQSLLQDLIEERSPKDITGEEAGIMLIVCQSEDHMLGALVLSDQLRRRAYSVKVLYGATESEVINKLSGCYYDLILFSCSGLVALEKTAEVIHKVKQEIQDPPPVILGGPVLDVDEEMVRQRVKHADIITKDINRALQCLGKGKMGSSRIGKAS